jgi:hypothetical protein
MRLLTAGVALAMFHMMTGVGIAQKPPAELTWDTFEATRDRVLPTEKELGWQAIPWRSDLGEVVAEATTKEMPILIWAMNGDPLGCT